MSNSNEHHSAVERDKVSRLSSEAVDFLTSLPGKWINLTAINPDSGKISGMSVPKDDDGRAKCAAAIASAQAKGSGVYFNINGLKDRLGRDRPKVKETDVNALHAFHVDADVDKSIGPAAFAKAKADLLAAIQAMNKPPTIIIDSGNGFGLFWMTRTPVAVTVKNRAALKAINIGLRDAVRAMPGGSADACQNLDRVMRVPFTTNFPNAAKKKRGRVEVPTSLIKDDRDFDVLYTVEDFAEFATTRGTASEAAPPDETPDIPETVDMGRLDPDLRELIEKNAKGQTFGDGSRSDYAFFVTSALIGLDFSVGDIVWILTNTDFAVSAHLWREDRTREPIAQALKMIADAKARGAKNATDTFKADPVEDIPADDAAERAREQKRVTWDSLRKEYVYVTEQEVFVERADGTMYSVKGFGNAFAYLKRDLETSMSLTNYIFTRKPTDVCKPFDKFKSFCYMPGEPENFGGKLNLWRPSVIVPVQGDVQWFFDHLDYLFGDDAEHVLKWCSWVYRFQSLHPKHALLTHGEHQGTGKSVIANAMKRLLGAHNCTLLDQTSLDLDHDGWKVRTKLLMIEEVRPGFGSSNAVAKKLHPLISEDSIHVDMKNRNDFDMPNVMAGLFGSNKRDALSMDDSDRRYLIVSTDRDGKVLKPKSRDYYRSLYGKDGRGGKLNDPAALAALAWEFQNRDLKGYSAQDPAPSTIAKRIMIEAGGGELQKWMRDNADAHPFDKRLVSVPNIVKMIEQDASDIVRRHRGNFRSDLEDILRRKFNGRHIEHRIRPFGRNGGKLHVWAIGPTADATAKLSERQLNAIYRFDYPEAGRVTPEDFSEDE